jgi:mono/diheme cytochrome c family protein
MGIVWKELMHKYWLAAAPLAGAVAIGAVLVTPVPYTETARIAQGQALYGVHCANCHGKNLEGQPNWRTPLPNGRMPAPPHDKTGHTWHHTDAALTGVTKLGLKPFAGDNYESDMPAFGTILSDEEIEAILAYIKSTWPERERNYQQQITQQGKPQ